MSNKSTTRNWFKTGLIPTQAQFWAFFDFIWFKDEMIPVENIEGLQELIDEQADNEAFQNHLADEDAHEPLFKKTKIYATGELQIFKTQGNIDSLQLEVDDLCIGIVENIFINAIYLGGDRTLLTSFNLINQINL